MTGLKAANTNEDEIAVGSGVLSPRILGHPWRQQTQIGEVAAIEGKMQNGLFINHIRQVLGLRFNTVWLGGDSNALSYRCDCQLED